MKKITLSLLFLIPIFIGCSQQTVKKTVSKIGNTANDFPVLVMTEIPGAPVLGKPTLISGENGPIISEGLGWAAPAVFDWDSDGKKDLLIGEFGSGLENPKHYTVGNFMRVYTNKGTDAEPRFSNEFNYAMPRSGTSNGTPMSVYTWCCIGFTPQIVDLNNDGLPDIVSGQYEPGHITWFKGAYRTDFDLNRFMPGEFLRQEGEENQHEMLDVTVSTSDVKGNDYWHYSAVSFGDFSGDGKSDMVVGGTALRLSENIGTRQEPKFGLRKLLLDKTGQPLKFCEISAKDLKLFKDINFNVPECGSESVVPVVIDWDNDGILDILATDCYEQSGKPAVVFFKGLKSPEGLRFEQGIPLFTAKGGGKAFPGSWLRVCVTDWNNDGIKDLVIGTSVATLNGGQFDYDLSWTWEDETKILKKSPAYYTSADLRTFNEQIDAAERDTARKEQAKQLKEGYFGKGNYTTLVHKGYVYVMLGKKN